MGPAAYDGRPWLPHYPDGVPETVDVPDAPVTRLLDDAVAAAPDSGALTFGARTLTYRQLASDVDALAAGLAAEGVQPGDRVALVLPNSAQFVIAFFAALRLGAVVVPCDPLAGDALGEHLVRCGVCVVIGIDEAVPATLPSTVRLVVSTALADYHSRRGRLRARVGRSRRPVCTRGGERLVDFRALVRSASPAPRVCDVDAASGAVYLATAGTTAAPKVVPLTHTNLVAAAVQLAAWLSPAPISGESVVGVLPLFHAYGLTQCLLTTMALRGRLVLLSAFDTEAVLRAIDAERPALFPALPAMLRAILDSAGFRRHDLRSLQLTVSCGIKLPQHVRERFERVAGCRVVESYGLTETAGVTMCGPVVGPRRTESVGMPLPNVTAHVDDGGELVVAGPHVFSGYLDSAGRSLRRDNSLRTGDVATVDSDGTFAVVDRLDDILVGADGTGICPSEVEQVILALPAVADCCVVAEGGRGKRVRLTAYAVLHPQASLTVDEVQAHVARRLPAAKVPTQVHVRDRLPRSLLGAVRRSELAPLAASQETTARGSGLVRLRGTSSK